MSVIIILAYSGMNNTFTDVWNSVTAGMIDRSNGEIAEHALERWRRAVRVN